jgi:hypothetical protein
MVKKSGNDVRLGAQATIIEQRRRATPTWPITSQPTQLEAWTTRGLRPHDRPHVIATANFVAEALHGFFPTRQESPSRSCNPVLLRLRVDRVSWSRSSEWRNARDTPAPEIPPAARTDGSIVDFPARFVSDCKSTGTWNKRLDTDLFPSGKGRSGYRVRARSPPKFRQHQAMACIYRIQTAKWDSI